MKKLPLKFLKLLLLPAGVINVYFAGILIINTVGDYRPLNSPLDILSPPGILNISEQDSYSILSWNIGYAGLGNKSDFFYDGGKMAKPDRDDFHQYFGGILEQVNLFDSLDYLLLQEVDIASSRSYGTDQHAAFSAALDKHAGIFMKNYDARYVPVPIFNPMAKVVSGLSFFSKYLVNEASCIVFPGNYTWPMCLFMPDRCFIQCIFELPSAKKLYIINTHNSAFDDGSLRSQQLELLYEYMTAAYLDGHYVIAGGDWNINPMGFTNNPFITGDPSFKLSVPDVVSGPDTTWQLVFDPQYPTNRDVSTPYDPGLTPATIIDYYVCSPNIRVLSIMTLYDGFKNSDHHPVYMRFGLK
jgi:endonuclease/exonuclease/phosphatase family metal-dependent hydrolase